MQTINSTFEGTRDQKGFHFTLLKRHNMLTLWQKTKHHQSFYEVVFLQHRPKKTWPDGHTTEAKESFPKPEDWGVLAWSPLTLQDAHKKFESLKI